MQFYVVGMRAVDFFCSCDLDLDPMTFIYELYPYCPEIHRMCNELPTSIRSATAERFLCFYDLDPMTFIYELDPYSLEIHRMCKYELSVIVW